MIRLRSLLGGFASYIPGLYRLFSRRRTGGTDNAEYCYEVWIKHLTFLRECGMEEIPQTVAELGPGDSLGIGLAALLSGAERYYAFDIVEYANIERNLAVFDRLVDLFGERAGKRAPSWPEYDGYLDERKFPSHILTRELLQKSLSTGRVERIRRAVQEMNTHWVHTSPRDTEEVKSVNGDVTLSYIVSWNEQSVIKEHSVDLILSHSVLEHVDDLEGAYRAMWRWLRTGGYISHQIDFRSHGLTEVWNGHWGIPEVLWKLAVGKRPYLLNRQPCSRHIELIKSSGFDIIYYVKRREESSIERSHLAKQWGNISEEDLWCSGVFVQGQKRD